MQQDSKTWRADRLQGARGPEVKTPHLREQPG